MAPISAPILQIVPFPVHERLIAPGPKYSTIEPVPPLTVSIPANFKIISFRSYSFKIILISITKNIKNIDIENLGAKFYDQFKDSKQNEY